MSGELFEWWVEEGQNLLEGIPGSALDPPEAPPQINTCTGEIEYKIAGAHLSDAMIVSCLRSSPAARASFLRLVPTMTLEEQERLMALYNGPARYLKADPKAADEVFMRAMNGLSQARPGPGPLLPGDPRRNR